MVFETLLAQRGSPDWGDLIYLLIFLVIPLLNVLGKKVRDMSAKSGDDKGGPLGRPGGAKKRGGRVSLPKRPAASPEPPRRRRPAEPLVLVDEFGREVIIHMPGGPAPSRPPAMARPARPVQQPPTPPRQRPSLEQEPPTEPPPRQEAPSPWSIAAGLVQRRTAARREPRVGPSFTSLSRAQLRRAFVLSEILRPPVALRDDPGLFDRITR